MSEDRSRSRALRWIYETSLRNPLYVRELTLGALTDVHGLWRMPVRPPVSASLTELIAVRVTGLADAEQRALELLALGEPLRVCELIPLTGGLRFSQGRFIEAGRWLGGAELQLEQHDAGGLLAITNSM